MSLQNMNSSLISPKKDYSANRLKSGALQLAERTHLILNETAMEPGQLDATGKLLSIKLSKDLFLNGQELRTRIISGM